MRRYEELNDWFKLFYVSALSIDAGIIAGVIAAIWLGL